MPSSELSRGWEEVSEKETRKENPSLCLARYRLMKGGRQEWQQTFLNSGVNHKNTCGARQVAQPRTWGRERIRNREWWGLGELKVFFQKHQLPFHFEIVYMCSASLGHIMSSEFSSKKLEITWLRFEISWFHIGYVLTFKTLCRSTLWLQ